MKKNFFITLAGSGGFRYELFVYCCFQDGRSMFDYRLYVTGAEIGSQCIREIAIENPDYPYGDIHELIESVVNAVIVCENDYLDFLGVECLLMDRLRGQLPKSVTFDLGTSQ